MSDHSPKRGVVSEETFGKLSVRISHDMTFNPGGLQPLVRDS
jgi:hypothetical protein